MNTHVTFLTRSLEVGGAETQLVALARALQQTPGFSASVVTFYPGGALEETLRDGGVAVVTGDKQGRWDLLAFTLRLRVLLRRSAPALVHSFLGPPNLMAALLRPFLPRARLVWGVRASDMDLSQYDWTWQQVFRAERFLSRVPDRIVANSYAGRDHVVAAGFPAARMAVVPNGIDTDRYRPDPGARERLRREWGVDGPIIGMVARLDPMKDHANFLFAAHVIAAEFPAVRFVCVGGGKADYVAMLQRQAANLGLSDRIIWTGERRDVAALLGAFDIATLSSAFGEGFPNAVGEAMACGRPAAVTDVGDSAMVVGDTGRVVPRRDSAALAAAWRAMLALSTGDRDALGAAARRRIVEEYSVGAMVSRTAALYREILQAA